VNSELHTAQHASTRLPSARHDLVSTNGTACLKASLGIPELTHNKIGVVLSVSPLVEDHLELERISERACWKTCKATSYRRLSSKSPKNNPMLFSARRICRTATGGSFWPKPPGA
jgi:hypothetical protein